MLATIEKIETFIQKHQNGIDKILFVLLFGFLFLAIYSRPYSSDDTIYMYQWKTTIPLSSLQDIVTYEYYQYMYWGGRIVAHATVQLLFLLGKPWSSMLITGLIAGLAYFMCRTATQNGKVNSTYFYLAMAGLCFLNPSFDETVLWYTGMANYLWTVFLVVVGIQPLVRYLKDPSTTFSPKDYAFLVILFLAGWGMETVSVTLILFELFVVWKYYKKTHRVSVFLLLAILVTAVGCGLLLLAPGNFARLHTFQSGLMSVLYRGHGQVNAWCNWLFPALFLLGITSYQVLRNGNALSRITTVFTLWGALDIFIMVVFPSFPSRATFSSVVFFLVAILGNLEILEKKESRFIRLVSILTVLAFIGCLASIGILEMARSLGANIPG